MWYLSENLSRQLEKLSRDLIAKNGWMDQFAIANKVMCQFHSELAKLNLGKPDVRKLRKELVDTLIVMQHPINQLNISDAELHDIGFSNYVVNGVDKPAKIGRTYCRVFGDENYVPTKDLQTELDIMAAKVMARQYEKRGIEQGTKFQIYRAMEELLELSIELSKYIRIQDTTGSAGPENRMAIIDELYDVLFTIRYVMLALNITRDELEESVSQRIDEIYNREINCHSKL
ncbi:MAG: hypothetical protein FWE52_01180 [Alphaproteobacteria bacterium]|nr:hypothetical protein [Alphaproteobacteria bacterium]